MSDSEKTPQALERRQGIGVPEVREQLRRLVNSPSFRSSKRYPRFLTYIVEKELAGAAEELKERLIGIEVFDRTPDYDHTADPCVRVAASEIRKRLAQYYVQPGCEAELRVELPAGAYVPLYYWPAPATPIPVKAEVNAAQTETPVVMAGEQPTVASKPRRPWGHILSVLLPVLVLICALIPLVLRQWREHAQTSLDYFWEPFLHVGNSTLICVGNIAFEPQSDSSKIQMNYDTGKTIWDVWSSASRVGPNGVSAAGRVAAILGKHDRAFTIQVASMTTLSDLHGGPAVLIGSMNNPWTRKALAEERFQIQAADQPDTTEIIDSETHRHTGWIFRERIPISQILHAYAVVDRHFSYLTGHPVLVIAGLGPFGANAASEFVSNPFYFEQFARQAPSNWKTGNVEIVLETDVIDGRTGAPRVIAFDVR